MNLFTYRERTHVLFLPCVKNQESINFLMMNSHCVSDGTYISNLAEDGHYWVSFHLYIYHKRIAKTPTIQTL